MAEEDAIKLLVNLSKVHETKENKGLAAQIVKVFVSEFERIYFS